MVYTMRKWNYVLKKKYPVVLGLRDMDKLTAAKAQQNQSWF